MSRESIREDIRRYEDLRDEAQEKLRKFEEELKNLLSFNNRYELGKADFSNNINHRKTRVENVNFMSQKVKSGKAYYSGMNEDLTGIKYYEAINNVDSITDKINKVIRWLEEEIEKLKEQIARYNNRISELQERLSREDDD